MFEKFTDKARRTVVRAQEEAKALNHNYIGTEHLLMGMVQDQDHKIASILNALGVTHDNVLEQVQETVGVGELEPTGHIPFTPNAKKVLESAHSESIQLGQAHIGNEHLVLGITRESECQAFKVLVALGVEIAALRARILELIANFGDSSPIGEQPE